MPLPDDKDPPRANPFPTSAVLTSEIVLQQATLTPHQVMEKRERRTYHGVSCNSSCIMLIWRRTIWVVWNWSQMGVVLEVGTRLCNLGSKNPDWTVYWSRVLSWQMCLVFIQGPLKDFGPGNILGYHRWILSPSFWAWGKWRVGGDKE